MKKLKFKNIIELWKYEKCQYVKQSTYASYVCIIDRHIKPYFGEMYQIDENAVQNFVLIKTNSSLSIKTVKDIIIVLKMILKYAAKQNLLPYIQTDIKLPTTQKNLPQILNRQDCKKILTYINNNFTFKNLGIYICLSTGLRIGEICGLKWGDINMQEQILTVQRTLQRICITDNSKRYTQIIQTKPKTVNSYRQIPLPAELIKILKPLKKLVNNDYYVLTNDISPTEPRCYRNYFNTFIKKLGLYHIKFHALRHSFATRCIESKCDYKTVSVLLGHSSINTTLNLYVHPNLEQKKQCIQKMFKSLKVHNTEDL